MFRTTRHLSSFFRSRFPTGRTVFDFQDNQPRSNTWGSFPLFLADGRPADWRRSVTTSADWAYWNRKTQTLFGELRHQFDNGWSARASLSRRVYREDMVLFYMSGFPDPSTGLGLTPFASKTKGRITENALDLYASGPFELLGRTHELVLGYNGSRAKNVGTEYATPETLTPPGNFFAWDGRYPRPDFAQDGTPLNDIKTDQDGVYAVGRFSLADALKLIAGTRQARWKIDSFYAYDTPPDSSYSYSELIPYAGLVWDVRPDVSVFTSYTRIFKPQGERDINGRYLDPIEGRSVEVGIKGEHFNRQLNTSLTLFDTRQSNVAEPVVDPETGEPQRLPDGSAVSQPIDGTRTRGFEFEATGRLSREWQGSFGWTRYLIKDADGQAVRTYIPNTIVRLFTTWEPSAIDGLRLGAGVDWQSATRTNLASPAGETVLRQASVTQLRKPRRLWSNPGVSHSDPSAMFPATESDAEPAWLRWLSRLVLRQGMRRSIVMLTLVVGTLAVLISEAVIGMLGHGDRALAAASASLCSLVLTPMLGASVPSFSYLKQVAIRILKPCCVTPRKLKHLGWLELDAARLECLERSPAAFDLDGVDSRTRFGPCGGAWP